MHVCVYCTCTCMYVHISFCMHHRSWTDFWLQATTKVYFQKFHVLLYHTVLENKCYACYAHTLCIQDLELVVFLLVNISREHVHVCRPTLNLSMSCACIVGLRKITSFSFQTQSTKDCTCIKNMALLHKICVWTQIRKIKRKLVLSARFWLVKNQFAFDFFLICVQTQIYAMGPSGRVHCTCMYVCYMYTQPHGNTSKLQREIYTHTGVHVILQYK